MPYASVEELKKSPSYKRSKTLQNLSDHQLSVFVATFNSVIARAKRQGNDEAEAEGVAFPIAYSRAKNASLREFTASLEPEVHYFQIMMPDLFGRGEEDGSIGVTHIDTEFLKQNLASISEAVAGNAFNWEHDHGLPIGAIRGLVPIEQVPAHIREGFDQDAPFAVLASYAAGVPEKVKSLKTISPEWDEFEVGGRRITVPSTFAVTEKPLNPDGIGVKRVSALANVYKDGEPKSEAGLNMADAAIEKEGLGAKVLESLKASLDEEKGKVDALTKEISAIKSGLASLVNKEEDEVDPAVDLAEVKTAVASLKESYEKTVKELQDTKKASLEKEAADWAKEGAAEGKYPTDAIGKFASLYVKDAEMAKSVVASLPTGAIKVEAGKASSKAAVESKIAGFEDEKTRDEILSQFPLFRTKKVN